MCSVSVWLKLAATAGKVFPDRRELDQVVCEALELTEAEQLAVYHAVVVKTW